MNQLVNNPFGDRKAVATATGVGASDQERAIQEVQAALVIAKKFPRDPIEAMDKILQMCTRPTLAESALYSYSRGGSDITGPSIRLAECIAQGWGNMQAGVRELSQHGNESQVEAFAWDLESNMRVTKVFTVPHIRHTKSGVKTLTDPRDIYETIANNGARRLRACILGVVPGDVVEAATKQCEVTLASTADTSPDAMKKVVEAFKKFGVTKEQIEKRIQRRMDAIQPAQVVMLRKIYTSLKDGMSSPEEWFEGASTEVPQQPRRKSEPKPEPAQAEEPRPEEAPDLVSAKQVKMLRDFMQQFGVTDDAFCEEMAIESVEQLPAAMLNNAIEWMRPAPETED